MAKAIDRPRPTAALMMGPLAPSVPLLPHPFQPILWLLDPAAEFLRPPVGITKVECLKCWASSMGPGKPQLRLLGSWGDSAVLPGFLVFPAWESEVSLIFGLSYKSPERKRKPYNLVREILLIHV